MRISKTRSTKQIRAASAITASGVGTLFEVGTGDDLAVMLSVSAVSGTSPSMTVSVQWSNDGSTWFTADPADAFTAITTVGNTVKSFTVKGLYARLSYALTGTTPSFTVAAQSIIGD